jgi:hypothetical protein
MPLPASIREAAFTLLGHWFGDTYPERKINPLPPSTARDFALRRFREFFSLLTFSRKGTTENDPISFKIPIDRIFTEQPDNIPDLNFPALGMIPSRGIHNTYGLGPPDFIEDSFDTYGQGTALLLQGEYTERFQVEAWATHPAERQALLAGVQGALRVSQRSQALTLTLPDYFDRVATFRLDESQNVDDPDLVRNRRRGLLEVELTVPEVLLVDTVTLRPAVRVRAVDGGAGPCAFDVGALPDEV